MEKMLPDTGIPKKRLNRRMTTRSVVLCGLMIALMVVSAWVSIPIGPVPVTLQVFVMVFVLLVLTPRECLASISVYLVLGAIGLPVFSSMRGGLGVLLGPTGGFLWGFLLGAAIALLVLELTGKNRTIIRSFLAAIIFLVVMYTCGLVQFMAVTGLDPVAAAMLAVAPFVVVDFVKVFGAVFMVEAMKKALPALRSRA